MCGIAGLVLSDSKQNAAPDLLEAALLLQHRGQDACGIALTDLHGSLTIEKGAGLVMDVFGRKPERVERLHGSIGMIHVRYPTNGAYTPAQIQPIHGSSTDSTVICHNGNLINTKSLVEHLNRVRDGCHIGLEDSQLLLEIFESGLSEPSVLARPDLRPTDIIPGIETIYRECRGSFSCTMMIPTFGLIAFRDRNGIKPLVFGERSNATGGTDLMFASESVALDKLGFTNIQDVQPGEAIFVPKPRRVLDGQRFMRQQIVPQQSYTPDIFEYVYFARADSVIDGISVSHSRQLMGKALAETVIKHLGSFSRDAIREIDCVVPVPETSYTSALILAQVLGKPLSLGLVRNRYVFRTFIAPGQEQRRKSVWRKLSPVKQEIEGRNILLVDDSIVRGTTSIQIIDMIRTAGAKKVYLASCSPAIRYNHIHGIDLADRSSLVAYNRSNEQIRQVIGCDALIYLPLERLIDSCLQARTRESVTSFEHGVFSGLYVTDTTHELPTIELVGSFSGGAEMYSQGQGNVPCVDSERIAISVA